MKSIRFPLAALLFAAIASVSVVRADVLDTSLFAKKIHFTASGYAGASTLANFPVLVRLSDVSGFNFADFTTPVDELRFTDAAGNNLNYEIDTWDSTANKALVWVSVPSLSGTTTEIRAYFAPSSTSGLPAVSSAAVWAAAGYYGVWHMNETNAKDSSANHLDGTADASITVVDAKLGKGANFPSNAKIATTNTPNSAFTSAISFETWACPSEVTGEYALFGKEALATFKIKQGKTRFTTPGNTDFDKVTASVSANAWCHLVVSFLPKQAAKVYVNGTLDKSQTDTKGFNNLVNSCPIVFGSNQWNQYYKGILDECRLVTAALSDDWIAADYATQNNADFLTASSVTDCRSVDISLTQNGGTCAKFSSVVDGISLSGGQLATLKILYGTADDALNDELVVSGTVTASGLFPAQVKGLSRGTNYFFKAVLVLPNNTTIESAVLPVTMIADYATAMRRVEYVEGTGTQYIDSGYYPTPNTHVRADYQFTAVAYSHRVFGIEIAGSLYFNAYINSSGKFAYNMSDDKNWLPVGSGTLGNTNRNLHDFNYINGESQRAYTIYGPDGSVTVTQAPLAGTATISTEETLTLAANRTSATGVNASTTAKHRIYSMLFDEGSALTAALAPAVRTSDGAVGLYDSARNMFLQSASAASYVLGPSMTTVEHYTGSALTAIDLTFLGAPMARTLKVAYGSGFGGDNPADWDVTAAVATVAAGATSYSVPVPANWGSEDACVLRCYFDDGTTFPLWSDTVIYREATEPIVTGVTMDGSGGDALVIRGNLSYFPGSDCTLAVRVTKSGGSPVVWSNLTNVTATGDFELTLLESDTTAARYIEPGATYSVVVEATSGETTGSSSPAFVTTKGAPVFVSSGTSVSQRKVTFTGNLGDPGANTNATVTLYVGTQNNANKLEPVETPVTRTAAGSFSIAHTFADFEQTYYWQLRAVATTAGGNAITTVTAVASCKTQDKTTYTWQAVDGEWNGNWNDTAHWANNKNGDCLGYPQSENATADFKDCTTNNPVVVAVNGKYKIGELKYYGSGASDITFAGTSTNESSLTASVTYSTGIQANSKAEFRDMTVTRTGDWDFQRNKAAATNILVRFSNVYSTGGMMGMSAAFSRLEFIDSEITCSSRFNFGSSNSVLLVSNSKIILPSNQDFHFGADVGIKGPVEMIISGKDSKISANKFYVYGHSDGYDATITLMVPVGGFAEAPLQQTGDVKFQNGGGANSKIKFAVSPASPALRRSEPVLSNHVIVEALKKGFETARTGDGNGGIGDSQAGVPGWAFKWGVNGTATSDTAAARQILLDLEGHGKPPTMFVIY
ncbi:MAG: DUF2341 domain-containing protein [Kiritimatiellae bacterium]|nr:DUF2341 domain-containing protein [Kiritimatiellia bacterium]